jgi:ribosomal protein S18 acetylase RimI-like enzyme
MIRPARPEDIPTIKQIVDSAYRHYIARIGKPPGPMLDDYARRVGDGQAWVLEHEGAIAGLLVLEDSPGALLLDNVAINPAAQGKGHGQALIGFAEQEARGRGYQEVRLYTHVLMTENLALYARLGFRETGRVCEKGYERVYMTKALTPQGPNEPSRPAGCG